MILEYVTCSIVGSFIGSFIGNTVANNFNSKKSEEFYVLSEAQMDRMIKELEDEE